MIESPDFDPKPTIAFVSVTPEMARRWLARNTRNRNIRKQTLDSYKRDMRAGNWRLEGSPIKFAPDGTLLDGQHRLTAIMETGVTVVMAVARGIAPEAQTVMDTGRKRTAADVLAIGGQNNSSMLAAAARLMLTIEGDFPEKYEPSHEEIANCVADHPGLADACDDMKQYARRADCPPAIVAYTYYVLSQISPDDALDFWRSAAEKVGLHDGDPVLALTNRFAEARRNREWLPRRSQISMIYRAWNSRRQGKPLRRLRTRANGVDVQIPVPR